MNSTNPARVLSEALARMTFALEPGRFALVGFEEPPSPADFDFLEPPAQLVVEGGETSLLIRAAHLPQLLAQHPDAAVAQDLRWVRFEAPMGWEVVGFLALVTGKLAQAGIPIGAICGYSRDHLFIGEAHMQKALAVLTDLFPRTHCS